MSGNTFINVSGSDTKLGEFKPVSKSELAVDYDNFYLMIIGTDGNPLYVNKDEQIKALPNSADIIDKYGSSTMQIAWVKAKNAWYIYADSASSKNRKFPLTDYVIPAGAGFLVRCSPLLTAGVDLVYNGAVNPLATPFDADTDTFSVSANVAPCDIKLGNVTVESKSDLAVDYDNFYLMMVGTDGNPRFVKDDDQIKALPNATDIIDKYGSSTMQIAWVKAKNAWYIYADSASSKNRKFPLTDYVIPAGAGFLVRCSPLLTAGVRLTLPSALEEKSTEE